MLFMCASVTDWIQAISAALLVPLTAATLFYLVRYTRATLQLKRISERQLEEMHRPLLVLTHRVREGDFTLKNVGTGPALNVRWSASPDAGREAVANFVSVLEANTSTRFHMTPHAYILSHDSKAEVAYESSGGVLYSSRFSEQRVEGAEVFVQVSFSRGNSAS